jgi:RNA polymerase sigma-70 factor (ECF subfamily)
MAIVRNTFATWCQRKSRDRANLDFNDAVYNSHCCTVDQNKQLDDAAKVELLRACINELPIDYREIIVMCELEEMSYRQIAEVASLPVGTVMSRLSRAPKRLESCAKKVRTEVKGR